MNCCKNNNNLGNAYKPKIGQIDYGFLIDNYNPYYLTGCGQCLHGKYMGQVGVWDIPSINYINELNKNEKK
tara:strand:- start:2169 stop:2381 length:213 start_codon:yes stop_codon:yes gene_type:complete